MTTETNRRPKQSERVLQYMRKRGSITQFEAMNRLGVMRLASRISELKKDGYPIRSRMDTVKNRFGESCSVKRYYLEEGDKNP
ncbi:MAG: helix-turn-helix domain-containing protein [Aristaeellaceae bacterium]